MTAHTSAHASDPVAPELVEFRREVDAWINENFPAELRTEEKQEEFKLKLQLDGFSQEQEGTGGKRCVTQA